MEILPPALSVRRAQDATATLVFGRHPAADTISLESHDSDSANDFDSSDCSLDDVENVSATGASASTIERDNADKMKTSTFRKHERMAAPYYRTINKHHGERAEFGLQAIEESWPEEHGGTAGEDSPVIVPRKADKARVQAALDHTTKAYDAQSEFCVVIRKHSIHLEKRISELEDQKTIHDSDYDMLKTEKEDTEKENRRLRINTAELERQLRRYKQTLINVNKDRASIKAQLLVDHKYTRDFARLSDELLDAKTKFADQEEQMMNDIRKLKATLAFAEHAHRGEINASQVKAAAIDKSSHDTLQHMECHYQKALEDCKNAVSCNIRTLEQGLSTKKDTHREPEYALSAEFATKLPRQDADLVTPIVEREHARVPHSICPLTGDFGAHHIEEATRAKSRPLNRKPDSRESPVDRGENLRAACHLQELKQLRRDHENELQHQKEKYAQLRQQFDTWKSNTLGVVVQMDMELRECCNKRYFEAFMGILYDIRLAACEDNSEKQILIAAVRKHRAAIEAAYRGRRVKLLCEGELQSDVGDKVRLLRTTLQLKLQAIKEKHARTLSDKQASIDFLGTSCSMVMKYVQHVRQERLKFDDVTAGYERLLASRIEPSMAVNGDSLQKQEAVERLTSTLKCDEQLAQETATEVRTMRHETSIDVCKESGGSGSDVLDTIKPTSVGVLTSYLSSPIPPTRPTSMWPIYQYYDQDGNTQQKSAEDLADEWHESKAVDRDDVQNTRTGESKTSGLAKKAQKRPTSAGLISLTSPLGQVCST